MRESGQVPLASQHPPGSPGNGVVTPGVATLCPRGRLPSLKSQCPSPPPRGTGQHGGDVQPGGKQLPLCTVARPVAGAVSGDRRTDGRPTDGGPERGGRAGSEGEAV